jgi:hypothetical protein
MADDFIESDGSASDALNAFASIYGAGAVMDSFRKRLAASADKRRQAEIDEVASVAAHVHSSEVTGFGETEMRPTQGIPQVHYHKYAADFRMKAAREGIILEGNGYECWECADFLRWYRKKHPELVYVEGKRNATIITPATKYTSLSAV